MVDQDIVEYRHGVSDSEEDRKTAVAAFNQGVSESGIGRRPLIRNSLLGAMAPLVLPAIVALRHLDPLAGTALEHTVWKKGMRIVNDVSGTPIRPQDVEIGQLVNAEPAIFYEVDEEGEPVLHGHEIQAE